MFRRITVLIPLLMTLTLSSCLIFPDGGWHHHHHRHHDGGHGYHHRR